MICYCVSTKIYTTGIVKCDFATFVNVMKPNNKVDKGYFSPNDGDGICDIYWDWYDTYEQAIAVKTYIQVNGKRPL